MFPREGVERSLVDVLALKDRLTGHQSARFSLEELTELGLESPVEVAQVYRDPRFQPTPRQILLWPVYFDEVKREQHGWLLGRNFIQDPINQFYLTTLIDRSIDHLSLDPYRYPAQYPMDEQNHRDLSNLVTYRLARGLHLIDKQVANTEERRRKIANTAMGIYAELPIRPE